MEVYPEEIPVVFLYSLCGTLISAPVCLYAEKDFTSFLLKPGVSLASIMYTGALVSSLGIVIHTWGLHLKGPVYISLFKPLSIVIAVGMAAVFLGDALHLGRSRRLFSAKYPLFFKMFLLGFLGVMAQIAGCKGMECSSPTLSSAVSNLTPDQLSH